MTAPVVIGLADMRNVNNILIYGAGMMGKSIAMVLSSNPLCSITMFDVVDYDVFPVIRANFAQLVSHGVLTQNEVEERVSRIRFTADSEDSAIAEADVVVECVFEDMALKQDTFAKLEKICREDCIFCTNTSVMSPTEISAKLMHKNRFVGTHFWNPAHLIPLVEVVRTQFTDDEVVESVLSLLRGVGKKAVLCQKDVPGFIANRMQHALWREAISIVENGIADAETVDEAVRSSFGLRLPQLAPLENADMVGLELTKQIHAYILPHIAASHAPSPLLDEHLEKGELGYKSGQGFFRRSPEEIAKQKDDLNEYLIRMIYQR